MNITIPDRNLFKWIGGKKWLKNNIQNKIKQREFKEASIYIEPFCGGLGAFKSILPILEENQFQKIILNDINTLVIETFKATKSKHKELIKAYENITTEFFNCFNKEAIECSKFIKDGNKLIETKGKYFYYDLDKTRDKIILKSLFLQEANDFFNKTRKEFNIEKFEKNISVECIAKFLFLMENCFNGTYRENSKGEFNTPFNWGNAPKNCFNKIEIIKEYNLFFNEIDITFENLDVFSLFLKYKSINAFLYLDPPYLNLSENSANKYNKDAFCFDKQLKLLNYTLSYKYVLYSNHDLPILKDFLKKNLFDIDIVFRKNIMSSKNDSRKNDVAEILAFKYDI